MEKYEQKAVAVEILKQLGGHRFITMTGAKNLASDTNLLTFRIMRNASKITHVKIVLNIMDTYDITFYSIRGTDIKREYKIEGVYNEDLRHIFTRETGLYTNL